MPRKVPKNKKHRLVLEELEPRLLLSGGLESVLIDSGYMEDSSSNEDTLAYITDSNSEDIPYELVIIDANTPDQEQLIKDLLTNLSADRQIEIAVIDSSRDGITQITDILAQYQNLDAVHIVSHGNEQGLQLGDTWLTADSLNNYTSQIASWGNALTQKADILIYGCNLAASADGLALLNELGNLTDADIAASDDLTGHAALGGDWELEYSTGMIESGIAFSMEIQKYWNNVLATYVDDFTYGLGELTTLTPASPDTWTTAWVKESGSVNANVTADSGAAGAGDDAIFITRSGAGSDTTEYSRLIDLSSATGTEAILTFNYRELLSHDSDDYIEFFVSTDGTSWTSIFKDFGNSSDIGYEASGDISISSTYFTATTEIKFYYWADAGPTNGIYIDDLVVTYSTGNAAPVLDNSGSPTLTGITEDDTTNSGTLISTIVGSTITDSDGDPEGIAVTGLTSGNGTWEYKIGAGAWTAVGTVNATSSLLLAATDSLRFVPDGNNSDSATITYRAWDQTSGAAGSKVDTSSNGGTTAFSTAEDTASITVTAVNDAPVLDNSGSPTLTTITEDDTNNSGDLVSAIVGATITDVDTGAVEGIAVTGLTSGNGIWEYKIGAGAWTAVGTVNATSSLLLAATDSLRFVPDGNNSDSATITYRAWDTTSGAAGSKVDTSSNGGTTAFSTAEDTASITVTAVNDAPSFTAGGTLAAVDEDTAAPAGATVTSLIGANFSDVDTGDSMAGIAITADASGADGTWQYSTDSGSTWYDIGTVSTNSALLLNNTTLLRFVPASNYNGTPGGLTVYAVDDSSATTFTSGATKQTFDTTTDDATSKVSASGQTIGTSINAVNDAPVLTPTGTQTLTTITEDDTANSGDLVSAIVGATITDVDTGAVEGIAVTGLTSGNGTWEYKIGAGAWTAVGTVNATSSLLLAATD
ncbi:MAG: DUF4347 domain-containing protein, partial [Gammaproteobacteria bacterium]|nr:DUF4347 domain-containing protein [Gammaproteobacteria bacterium]